MKKAKISIIQVSRLLIQIIFFIFLPSLYIDTFAGIKQIYIALIRQNIAFTQLIPQLVEVVVIIPFTVIIGRFFCGWMCAYGAFGDFIYKISSKVFKIKFEMSEDIDRVFKYLKYILLSFLIFAICTFNITAFSSFNPWDVFGMVASVGKAPDFSYAAVNLTVGFILFILIGIASMFIERFFCRYLCPLGAVFAIISKLKIAKIQKLRTKCGNCRICTNNCAMEIPLYKYDVIKSGECINCMQCITACPRKNITLTVCGDDVRPLIAGAAAVSVMTGFYYVGNLGVSAAGLNNTQTETQSTQSTATADTLYKDGTYEGSGTGFREGITTVSVIVKNGKITDITTLSYQDDKKFYDRASGTVIGEIIDSQSTNVDAVSGATYSSNGIMEAVENALSNARISTNSPDSSSTIDSSSNDQQITNSQSNTEVSSDATTSTNSQYKDGTYEGSGTGFRGGTTTVSVVVKNGKITDITTLSYQDDEKFYDRAASTVIEEIIDSQSTSVDAVSGATFSSNGIMESVENALSNAKQ
ncbi:FMN-binding protein [Clostridium kluyveri]|uniref:FMN-binding protein n=1 Tax=Clostridium kluyveri TaxID=1534 RepID=UPI0022478311|nr:FMN-binding protein [Clostridium kluyveri]UZQ51201.1 FMN-binding protein [Clostridium kluyveri]